MSGSATLPILDIYVNNRFGGWPFLLHPHHASIKLMERTNLALAEHMLDVPRIAAAQFEIAFVLLVAHGSLLDELRHLAVVDGNEAGWPKQIRMLDPAQLHLVAVVLIAEECPDQFGLSRSFRNEMTDREAVGLLMHDDARMQRAASDLTVRELGNRHHGRHVLERQTIAKALNFPGGVLALLTGVLRHRDRTRTARSGAEAERIAGTQQAERHVERAQQRGVVRIAQVLDIQLPVAGQHLPLVAEHTDLARKQTIDSWQGVVEIRFEIRRVFRKRRPHDTIALDMTKFSQSMLCRFSGSQRSGSKRSGSSNQRAS